ncbi:hypothetical protein A3715_17175 [Oleiphilus sp. HI0009]|nr:hypothetical protein A3715_17175 [Oleiphilus sp. HI0009]
MGRKSFLDLRDQYVSFEECKRFARDNGLTSFRKWYLYGPKPHNIPGDPTKYDEWNGWPDFTGSIQRDRSVSYCSYHECSIFAQNLNIKSADEWKCRWKNKKMPDDKYPRSPQFIYGEEFKHNGGWKGFLGIEFMSYEEAKTYIQTFCFSSFKEFREWACSDSRPSNFYAIPHRSYASEFESYPEFIGYGISTKQNINNALEVLDSNPKILNCIIDGTNSDLPNDFSFNQIIHYLSTIDESVSLKIKSLVGENPRSKKEFSDTVNALRA